LPPPGTRSGCTKNRWRLPPHPLSSPSSSSRSSGNRASIGARRATVTRIADRAADFWRGARRVPANPRMRAAHCELYCLRLLSRIPRKAVWLKDTADLSSRGTIEKRRRRERSSDRLLRAGPLLINADAELTKSSADSLSLSFLRGKVIARHYRAGNGPCTAAADSLDSVCDVIMFIVPSGRLLGNLGKRHVR